MHVAVCMTIAMIYVRVAVLWSDLMIDGQVVDSLSFVHHFLIVFIVAVEWPHTPGVVEELVA